MSQVIAGLTHMHEKGIAHRDLKVENILLYGSDTFKITDFGSASKNHFLDYKTNKKEVIFIKMDEFESQTTHMYRPPEMLDKYAGY